MSDCDDTVASIRRERDEQPLRRAADASEGRVPVAARVNLPICQSAPFSALLMPSNQHIARSRYVDGSIVEVIANDRAPVSAIVTPPAGGQFEVVDVLGGEAAQMKIWELTPTVLF